MAGLFTILFLVSVVLWVWGMIAPRHFAKYAKNGKFTRKTAGIGFGFFVLVFFVLVGITAPPQKPTISQTNLATVQAKPQVQADTVVTKQETETKSVPFTTQNQDDASLPKGQTKVIQAGVDGVETLTYNVIYTNGQQTDKTLVSDTVTTQPTTEIIANGTYVYVAPAPDPTPTPTPTPPSCYPLTNGGNCYEPGEYCRNSDHGASGVAGDGEAITCAYNNGWRWEPN